MSLTPRDLDVVVLLAQGLPNKQIAYHLGMSEQTVKFHVSHALAVTELKNRTELALWWQQRPANSGLDRLGRIVRCAVCDSLIWPWSRRGWLVTGSGVVQWWHAPRCSWVVTP